MGNCITYNLSDTQLKRRYQLTTRQQGRALKLYIRNLRIPLHIVDLVHDKCHDTSLELGGQVIEKTEFLAAYEIAPTPFAIGALNTLEKANKMQFFELFASLHNYCSFNRDDLVEHTFNLIDANGSGRLNIDDFILLVRHVYGEKVAKAEDGALIRTHNSTHIDTAHLVMKHMDVYDRGLVTLEQFKAGLRLHTNLIQPAFQVQRLLREALGGISLWDQEETRLHRKLSLLKHKSVVKVFHNSLRVIKDPKKNRGSFNEKGVAGQGGLSQLGDYDIHGNQRGKHGESIGVNVSAFQHHSSINAELELGGKSPRRHQRELVEDHLPPKQNTYDDWRKKVKDQPPLDPTRHGEDNNYRADYGNFNRKNDQFDKKSEKKTDLKQQQQQQQNTASSNNVVVVGRSNLSPRKHGHKELFSGRQDNENTEEMIKTRDQGHKMKTPRSGRSHTSNPNSARNNEQGYERGGANLVSGLVDGEQVPHSARRSARREEEGVPLSSARSHQSSPAPHPKFESFNMLRTPRGEMRTPRTIKAGQQDTIAASKEKKKRRNSIEQSLSTPREAAMRRLSSDEKNKIIFSEKGSLSSRQHLSPLPREVGPPSNEGVGNDEDYMVDGESYDKGKQHKQSKSKPERRKSKERRKSIERSISPRLVKHKVHPDLS